MVRAVQPRTVRWLAAIVLISLIGSSLAQRYFGHAMAVPDLDFYDYYFAAQAVREHPRANLYEGATEGNPQLKSAPKQSEIAAHARAEGFQDTELYLYPPLLADLLAPVSWLPARLAAALWRGWNLALVLAAMALLAPLLRLRLLSAEFAILAAAAYWFWPVHEAVSDGQVTILLLMLWAAAIAAYAGGRVALSAVALALATALKLTPAAILPVFVLWKERRWLAAYLAALAGLTALMAAVNGPENLRIYAAVIGAMGQGIPAIGNKSLTSMTAWLYYGRVFSLRTVHEAMQGSPLLPRLAAKAVSGAFFLGCLLPVWQARRRMDRTARANVLAIFALAICCLAPVSWRHGYTVALIPLAILWVRALRTPPHAMHLALLALTTFTQGTLFFDLAAEAPLPGPARIVCASLWVVLSCWLCLDALVAMRDPPGQTGSNFHFEKARP